MRKLFVIAAVTFCVVCVTAQDHANQISSPASVDYTGTADKTAKVLGCISQGNGAFSLTDSSGTVYRLVGDASKFTEHNGHKVEVTGTIAPSTSGQAEAQPTLTVSSIQHLASNCSASQ